MFSVLQCDSNKYDYKDNDKKDCNNEGNDSNDHIIIIKYDFDDGMVMSTR